MGGHLTLSMKELDRLQLMIRIAERRLTRRHAATLLGLSERQARRLYRAFRRDGADGLVSRQRGRPSARRLPAATQAHALALIRERYPDFGPTFAHQKLTEEHGLAFSVETLRGWMTAAGLWVPRAQRARRSYPPRERRACLGELVQIDGSEHAWFEDRGPRCTLLVYVDDANGTLQDRLVKELRLRGLSSIAAAEPFLPTFTADYNARFAKPARSPHDAHRPLHPSEELPRIFTLQETRRISAQLTVHYKRGLYVLEDCVDNRRLRRTVALVSEDADGSVTIRGGNDRLLPYRLFHTNQAQLVPGVVVEHKHLDAVFD